MKDFLEFLQSGHTAVSVLVLGFICFAIGAGVNVISSKNKHTDAGVIAQPNKTLRGH